MMVGMQLMAFGRVQTCRAERKERLRRKKEGNNSETPQKVGWEMDGANDRACDLPQVTPSPDDNRPDSSSQGIVGRRPRNEAETSDVCGHRTIEHEDGSSESEESETIL